MWGPPLLAALLLAASCSAGAPHSQPGDAPAAPATPEGPPPPPAVKGDLLDLVERRSIEVEPRGGGIEGVWLRLRRRVSEDVTVVVPAGTYFVSPSQSVQDMVTTKDQVIELTASSEKEDGWTNGSVPAACARRLRDIPGRDDHFTIRRRSDQPELAQLAPQLGRAQADFAVQQAAVWIVAGDASFEELGVAVRGSFGMYFPGPRLIGASATAEALRIIHEAGIDVTRKRIWRDVDRVFPWVAPGHW